MGFPCFLLLLILATKSGTLFLFPSEAVREEEVSALSAFKRAVSADPLARLSDWSVSEDPCGWSGVRCSDSPNRVISLNISNSSLKGFLAPEIGLLNSLQELILDNNLFYGTIPKQIGLLKSLHLLDLSANQLCGPIPSEIGGLYSVKIINLHYNGFTGVIPPELGNLVNLIELHLDRNNLTGPIPGSNSSTSSVAHGKFVSHNNATGLCKLIELEIADFSYNFLLGRVPNCLKHLPRSSFQGNCFQDRESILQRSAQQCIVVKNQEAVKDTDEQSSGRKSHQKGKQPLWLLILEIVTGAVVVLFVVICTVNAARRCKSNPNVGLAWKQTLTMKHPVSMSVDDRLLINISRYTLRELDEACEDFSNIIGSSPDSRVYKGTLKDGLEIAVVSLSVSESHWPSYLELCFQKEVANLARLNHENVAKLRGYCNDNEPFSRMLVFEYASNGTLHEHLHYGDACQLSWIRRMKISIGAARGLRYLHTEVQPPFTICEISSNAVYLTEDFSPKLVDFERWNTTVSRSDIYLTNGGLHNGFLENSERRNTDVQGNTFAFGVLLLELISGRPPYCKDRGSIVNWAMEYLHNPEKMSMLVDPELKNVKSDDLSVMCGVISLCVDPEPSKRPSMVILCAMLEDGIDTSVGSIFKESPLVWEELSLSV
ncbi:putative LRR receptor-like serine/threonine-protein kinase [Apostasia shenzhenica]|uniref:Putative LRR receptor-like serine/threonine-protein kinase n=1 Tax=Apostasia shenzhenica TaxID=1088818 RepID=A0A2I0A9E3_9ASPA|nr:putative LRR receptor-like serine/threonine-protein kinase [Apostasia shenzhenica]